MLSVNSIEIGGFSKETSKVPHFIGVAATEDVVDVSMSTSAPPYLPTPSKFSAPDQSSALKSLLAVIEYYEELFHPYDSLRPAFCATWNGGTKSLAFLKDAKLGEVRRALNRPYHTVALIWHSSFMTNATLFR